MENWRRQPERKVSFKLKSTKLGTDIIKGGCKVDILIRAALKASLMTSIHSFLAKDRIE